MRKVLEGLVVHHVAGLFVGLEGSRRGIGSAGWLGRGWPGVGASPKARDDDEDVSGSAGATGSGVVTGSDSANAPGSGVVVGASVVVVADSAAAAVSSPAASGDRPAMGSDVV